VLLINLFSYIAERCLLTSLPLWIVAGHVKQPHLAGCLMDVKLKNLKIINMTESFAQLFEESLKTIETRPGSIVRGVVVAIDKDIVLVDAGLKSESAIPAEQFKNAQGELEIQVGDEVDVALDAVEDGFGETLLSREKAKRHEAWITLEKAYEEAATVTGVINGKVKGGFTVELNGIRAFLPGSLVDVRPVRDTLHLEGKELEFKVIKLDQKRNNVVVSRRAVIESENSAERDQLLENLQEGMEVKGIVKNLTDYGAFVDLGGVDGLLHITDMAWKRVKHPSEIVNVGDEITVKVLKFDRERTRVSLGLKQLGEDPWVAIAKRYPEGTKLTGRVTNLTDYGCFVEIEEGVEGLVHVSEMDWTNKNIHPSKVVNVGDVVEVMVLDIDEERRRISLGLKQCKSNPWQLFAETHNKGDRVEGKIKSITDFGIFIGLDGGIDGLVHLSDISWNVAGEEAVREYKKGDEIAAVVLQVDAERERISLGVKQLAEDPFNNYLSMNKKGTIVTGKVTAVDAKGATVELADGVEGYLRASEASRDRVEDATLVLNVGDEVEAKFTGVDRKNRVVSLSVRAKDEADEKDAIATVNSTNRKMHQLL
jgi:small subunit ribosomal protein S1